MRWQRRLFRLAPMSAALLLLGGSRVVSLAAQVVDHDEERSATGVLWGAGFWIIYSVLMIALAGFLAFKMFQRRSRN
jgi:hypothetical protein